jgi:hypothetical protein
MLPSSSGSKNKLSKKTASKQEDLLLTCVYAGFLLGLFFDPLDETETSVDFQRTTLCYIPQDNHNRSYENIKSYN